MTGKSQITKKIIPVEIYFRGDGTIAQTGPNSFFGGVVDPKVEGELHFNFRNERVDENGNLNPAIDEDTVAAAFQINMWGTSEGFRELAKYLLAVAEIDTGRDPSFHEHHEIVSGDGRTHLHIIVRKPPSEIAAHPDSKWISG